MTDRKCNSFTDEHSMEGNPSTKGTTSAVLLLLLLYTMTNQHIASAQQLQHQRGTCQAPGTTCVPIAQCPSAREVLINPQRRREGASISTCTVSGNSETNFHDGYSHGSSSNRVRSLLNRDFHWQHRRKRSGDLLLESGDPSVGSGDPSVGSGDPLVESSDPPHENGDPLLESGDSLLERGDSLLESGDSLPNSGYPSLESDGPPRTDSRRVRRNVLHGGYNDGYHGNLNLDRGYHSFLTNQFNHHGEGGLDTGYHSFLNNRFNHHGTNFNNNNQNSHNHGHDHTHDHSSGIFGAHGNGGHSSGSFNAHHGGHHGQPEVFVCCSQPPPDVAVLVLRQTVPLTSRPQFTQNTLPRPQSVVAAQPAVDTIVSASDISQPRVNFACGRTGVVQTRIVSSGFDGDVTPDVNAYPWTALLGWDTGAGSFSWRCGATLINERWVLTAAHCFDRSPPMRVRLGEHDYSNDADGARHEDFGINTMVTHPSYTRSSYHDLALLQLDRTVSITLAMTPVCLPWGSEYSRPLMGTTVTVAGWGATEHGGDLSPVLQAVTLSVFNVSVCDASYRQLPSYSREFPSGIGQQDFLCAGHRQGGRGACQGDSGGPLTYVKPAASSRHTLTHMLAGIVVKGYGCGLGDFPGLYTPLHNSQNLAWIKRVAF